MRKLREGIDDAVMHLGNEVAKKVIDDIKNVLIAASEDDAPEDILTAIENIISGGEDGSEDGGDFGSDDGSEDDEGADEDQDHEEPDGDEDGEAPSDGDEDDEDGDDQDDEYGDSEDDEDGDDEDSEDDGSEDDEDEIDDEGDNVKKKKKKKKSDNGEINLSPSISNSRFQENVNALLARARGVIRLSEGDIDGDNKSLVKPKNPGKSVQKRGGSLSNRSRINSSRVAGSGGSSGLSESVAAIKKNILKARRD